MNHAVLEFFSWRFLGLAFGTAVRSTALACVCGMAAWLLRSRTAELRFMVWKWMLFALFTLPVLTSVTPALSGASRLLARAELSVLPAETARVVATQDQSTLNQSSFIVPLPDRPVHDSNSWMLVIPTLYAVVTAVLLARLGFDLTRLRRLADGTEVVRDPDFREISHEVWLRSEAFVTPREAVSPNVSAPVTFDADDAWILVPPSWRLWSKAKLGAVLAHEMAHVRRGDSQTLLLANLATCVFWFHPLSWFLRNQLSQLAEEACDEAVISHDSTPEEYANYLIDFARDVNGAHGRLAGAIAVAGTSPMKRRIERLFIDATSIQQSRRMITAVAFALFLPALYLSAATRPQQHETPEQEPAHWPTTPPTKENLPKLEAAVAANPEDIDSRMSLLLLVSMNAQEEPFSNQLLWFIAHHPSIEALSMAQAMYLTRTAMGDSARSEISSAWESAIADRPGSPEVLSNAATFFESTNPERALDLLRHAQALSTKPSGETRFDFSIAMIYASAEAQILRPQERINNIQLSRESGLKLRQQLADSGDPKLLSNTGTILVNRSESQAGDPQFDRGASLIKQAIQLDPGNAKWTEALESAEAEPQRRLAQTRAMEAARAEQAQRPATANAIRIGAKVAEANLITKVDPVYPPLAIQAQLSGTVEFTATIDTDGKIENLQLLRGHPLLVNAAKQAVLQYVYKPTLLDGQAVKTMTEVTVQFNLDDAKKPYNADTPLRYQH